MTAKRVMLNRDAPGPTLAVLHQNNDDVFMTTSGEPRRKPGQQPKGPREAMTTRVHPDVYKVITARAREAGYLKSTSDYVAAILANEVGLPHLAPPPSHPADDDQNRLPLTG
ncbi:MAG: hypothetical protein L0H24_13440 [Microlunatus sp.]|nr:hypothetical protein [Microlunatus sp.]